ncbi:ATP-binding protein [Paenibacillus popilliae]|uniref:ATP-binding protein n=1 Tax=Paenibacillus popilliae TaxID=78057 RepID=UPI001F3A7FBA|nr:ATP-binding protein [Paenibacillus popilliae]
MEEIRRRAAKASSRFSTSRVEVNYECPGCKDERGYFKKIPQKYGDIEYFVDTWVDCECEKRRIIERLFKASAITEEFRKKSFDNFDLARVPDIVREAYAVTAEYVRDFETIKERRQNSIALLGRPGCGKTHLLMAGANELLRRGVGVVYFPWVETFNELKSDLGALNERIWRLRRADVLFMDDVFKGRTEPTAFQLEQLFAIVNHRYLENLPLMISSERSFAQMCSIDEAVGSRLREMARGHTVTLAGGMELNYRLRED